MVRAGSQPAFAEVMRRYRPALVSYASAFVAADRAAEIVEDCFWRARIVVTRTNGELALDAWLFTLVHDSAADTSRTAEPISSLRSLRRPVAAAGLAGDVGRDRVG